MNYEVILFPETADGMAMVRFDRVHISIIVSFDLDSIGMTMRWVFSGTHLAPNGMSLKFK